MRFHVIFLVEGWWLWLMAVGLLCHYGCTHTYIYTHCAWVDATDVRASTVALGSYRQVKLLGCSGWHCSSQPTNWGLVWVTWRSSWRMMTMRTHGEKSFPHTRHVNGNISIEQILVFFFPKKQLQLALTRDSMQHMQLFQAHPAYASSFNDIPSSRGAPWEVSLPGGCEAQAHQQRHRDRALTDPREGVHGVTMGLPWGYHFFHQGIGGYLRTGKGKGQTTLWVGGQGPHGKFGLGKSW